MRRSDKRIEVHERGLAEYMRAADQIRKDLPTATSILLSTEDDTVVAEAVRQYGGRWRFYCLAEERHNWDHVRTAKVFGGQWLQDLSFVSLYSHLWCDALVMTQASNWGRLIEELRATGNRSTGHVHRLGPPHAQA